MTLTKSAQLVTADKAVVSGDDIFSFANENGFDLVEGFAPRQGHVYTVTRAISARVNQNYDGFPSDELRLAYRTFLGKPIFVNHANSDPNRARGRVVGSRFVENGADKFIQVIQEVNAEKYPKLAHELVTGGLDSVSMGCSANRTICSYCGNEATGMFDMCAHVLNSKGQTLRRRTASGDMEDVLVYEECRDLGFFELSYVFDPADETAVVSTVVTANKVAEVKRDDVRVWCDLPGCRRWTVNGSDRHSSWTHSTGERGLDFCCSGHEKQYKKKFSAWRKDPVIRNPIKRAALKMAFGETEAPPPIDTMDPTDSEDNDDYHRYVEPPDVLGDPDLDKAQELDRREDEADVPEVPVPDDALSSIDLDGDDLPDGTFDDDLDLPFEPGADDPVAPTSGEGGPPPSSAPPQGAPTDAPIDDADGGPVDDDRERARQQFEERVSRQTRNRTTSRRKNQDRSSTAPKGHTMGNSSLAQRGRVASRGRVADQSRNDQGEKEDTFITQTPPAEPVETGEGEKINNTEENLVASIARSKARMARDQKALAQIQSRKARNQSARSRRATLRQAFQVGDKVKTSGDNTYSDGQTGTVSKVGDTYITVSADGGGQDLLVRPENLIAARRKHAEETATEVNPELSGTDEQDLKGDFESADPNEGVTETQPKDAARRNARRVAHMNRWCKAKMGKQLHEARTVAELGRMVRSYAQRNNVEARKLYPLVQRQAAFVKRAADDNEGESGNSKADTNDLLDNLNGGDDDKKESRRRPQRRRTAADDGDKPDWLDDKIDETSDDDSDKKESRRRPTAGARKGARRKVADEKLDVAAPDGRVDVERPTEDTTDDEAQESQFDKGDFGDNAGDDIADPDLSTDQNWAPGEGKQSSRGKVRTASGIQAVRLAEAYEASGIAGNESRWTLAAKFEKMSAAVVADRIALLEKVAEAAPKRARTASVAAGSHGARRAASIPPNLATGQQGAPQQRTAGAEIGNPDMDLFL